MIVPIEDHPFAPPPSVALDEHLSNSIKSSQGCLEVVRIKRCARQPFFGI
jgi:hypothetical protein